MGWKSWQFATTHDHYIELTDLIIKDLEVGDTVSDLQSFMDAFQADQKMLQDLFNSYKKV